jgi:hypothetical protein
VIASADAKQVSRASPDRLGARRPGAAAARGDPEQLVIPRPLRPLGTPRPPGRLLSTETGTIGVGGRRPLPPSGSRGPSLFDPVHVLDHRRGALSGTNSAGTPDFAFALDPGPRSAQGFDPSRCRCRPAVLTIFA